jgi:hypothetical protein
MPWNWRSEKPKFARELSGPPGQFKLKMALFPCPMT